MPKRVTYSQLEAKLGGLGFSKESVKGSHTIYRQKGNPGATIVLPFVKSGEGLVSALHLSVVRRILLTSGAVERDALTPSFFEAKSKARPATKSRQGPRQRTARVA
jgi:predicted RNA binding protein YcfA (HicA-like mRNA interferase family)